jgi:hypothetical protein
LRTSVDDKNVYITSRSDGMSLEDTTSYPLLFATTEYDWVAPVSTVDS